jgi:hypothetical protein
MLTCMDYSGAQRKLLACISLWRQKSSDYSGAQRNSLRDIEMCPSVLFSVRGTVWAAVSVLTAPKPAGP